LLILFFILGSAAGFRNVVRVAHNYDAARKKEREQQGEAAAKTHRASDGED
jgi:F0F1-type ATP synthase assembly protein I